MNGLGDRLRRQRIARGIELSEIASETRISSRYLEALETGDSKVLPGSIFAKNFARQYARLVGLDEREIEEDLQQAFPPEDVMPDPNAAGRIQLAPLPEAVGAALPLGPQVYRPALLLVLVLAGCSAMYMGWQKWQTQVAERAAAPQPLSAPSPAPVAAPPPSQPVTTALADPNTPPSGSSSTIELAVPPGSAGGGMAVRVVAFKKTWLSIAVNGRSVFSGTLLPNEARAMTGVERAKIVIGDACGVDVITDGKSIGPIGAAGQVAEVVLSEKGAQIRPRFKEGESKPAERPTPRI